MTSLFRKILGVEEYSVVISQYVRGGYGAGSEEHLHWAIVILTEERKLKGAMYQAANRIRATSEGGVVVWELDTAEEVSLEKSHKCLGGVRIGVVKQKDLKDLDAAILGHPPMDAGKPTNWNCRDWVMECVEILKERKWARDDIHHQGDLFPAMKQASKLTLEAGRPTVVELEDA